MKFLSRTLDNSNLMMINIYYDRGTQDYSTLDDVLDFVYKDLDTGKVYVEKIVAPMVEIYIADEEYRVDYYKHFISIDHCKKYTVHYKTRYKEIGDILGVSPKEARYCPFVYQMDLEVEHFYLMQFFIEYDKHEQKPLSVGFSDIESDIINCEGFADPGEAPPNAISYYDEATKNMYTLVCTQDNVPKVDPSHKKYEYYEALRKRFKQQTDDFIKRLDEFIAECERDFEPSYGKINYNILVFEDEISMAATYWDIVHKCANDICFFWNAPYDISNLCERPKVKGYNPNTFIPSPEFGKKEISWHEDKNATVHKRKHIFNTYTTTNFIDQMVIYAGVRSGKGKLPSVKLNAIASKELDDEKLDYSEYGNIKMFPYYDWWKFIKYNIKDVLLQVGIDRKTKDSQYIYAIMSNNCLKASEVFTSTTVVANSLRLFVFIENRMVMGSNKNKLFRVEKTEEQKKQEKKDKFAGAFVMHPKHASPTGFMLLGMLNKYIHDHAIDYDIGSEYPTYMLISNASGETMLGKVFLSDPDSIDLPLYENMYFVDKDDEDGYRKTADKSNLMVEGLSENNPTAFGQQYFKLPSFTMIAEHIEDNIDDFI